MGDKLEGTVEQRLEHLHGDIRHNERRIDDLESVLASLLQALAGVETKEERLEAVARMDVLPTMQIHRRLAS